MSTPLEINNQKIRKKSLKKRVFADASSSNGQFLTGSISNYSHHSNKKLKVANVCLLGIFFVCLALALLKTTGVIFKPVKTEAMKGVESVGECYLKEESYWERYGVSPEGLVLWLDKERNNFI